MESDCQMLRYEACKSMHAECMSGLRATDRRTGALTNDLSFMTTSLYRYIHQ